MMIKFINSALLSVSLCVSSGTFAGAAEQLSGLLSGYDTFSAKFEQYILNNDGRRAQETTGEMQLGKPDLFVWRTDEPFPQTIIGDGTYVWVYDPDLEQVTRRSGGNELNSAPSLLLNGQIDALKEDYSIREIKVSEGDRLFELLPQADNVGFQKIRLLFSRKQLSELMLEDHLGQRTTVLLSQQQRNPQLPNNHFSFTPPEGTDVIINDE